MFKIPDDLYKHDPLGSLTLQEQALALGELFNAYLSPKFASFNLLIDQTIARILLLRPELCTIPDEFNIYPLWNAILHRAPRTLKTLIKLDRNPRHMGQLLARSTLEYETPELVCSFLAERFSSMQKNERMCTLETMHVLIPLLNEYDRQILAPFFLDEIRYASNLIPLKKLIDESFDLETEVNNECPSLSDHSTVPFIDMAVYLTLQNLEPKVSSLLALDGMLYNSSVITQLTDYIRDPYDRDDIAISILFLDIIRRISRSEKINLTSFICEVNLLRAHQIDIQSSRYFHNQSIQKLLNQHEEDVTEHLRFLDSRQPINRNTGTQRVLLPTYGAGAQAREYPSSVAHQVYYLQGLTQ